MAQGRIDEGLGYLIPSAGPGFHEFPLCEYLVKSYSEESIFFPRQFWKVSVLYFVTNKAFCMFF